MTTIAKLLEQASESSQTATSFIDNLDKNAPDLQELTSAAAQAQQTVNALYRVIGATQLIEGTLRSTKASA